MASASSLRLPLQAHNADRVRAAVKRLRKKLGEDADNPAHIFNDHGVGTACPIRTRGGIDQVRLVHAAPGARGRRSSSNRSTGTSRAVLRAGTAADHNAGDKQWRQYLRDYVFPKLPRKRMGAITTADVLPCLVRIWEEKRPQGARVRQRIGAVMNWAMASRGYREDNPAGGAQGRTGRQPDLTLPVDGVHRTT